MAEPYLGQIQTFGFSYATTGWNLCAGQALLIGQNNALYSVIGVSYGGDGVKDFLLPDLRGRTAIGFGQGLNLSNYLIGQEIGVESKSLTTAQLPVHSHSASATGSLGLTLNAATATATLATPATGSVLATASDPSGAATPVIYAPAGTAASVALAGLTVPSGGLTITVGNTGGSAPVSVIQPSLVINYSIAVEGLYPIRS